ncbi:MAG: efflux RND transporter periplasmic adaptor subunit [Lachnospiraceae bacterium]|nr:efflux RND transporter periplasmic adaptor subunit [Lachnospiraceae bacterium]
MKKKVVIAILIVVLAGGGITGGALGYRAYQNSKLVAEVQSVSMLNNSFWGDSMESDGTVTNGQQQDIYVSTEQTIQEVFVTEGQEVSEGDPLLQYDMTNIDLAIEMKKLDIQSTENNIAVAQKELEKLKNTKPVSTTATSTPSTDSAAPSTPVTPSADTSVTTPDTVEEKTGDAYNYISTTAQPYIGDGSQENPYRFLCTKEAYVYGSYLNTLKSEGKIAVFEIHDGNTVDGALISAWTKVGAALEEVDPDAKWYVIDGSKVVDEPDIPDIPDEPVVPDTPSVPDDNQQSGYTADELAKEIADKEKELTKLDLDKRKAELALKQMENQSEDGMVYAEFNGTIKKVGDPDNLPNDGSAFLTLSGSDGLYVKGTLNELALEQVKVGQSVTATSWSTGMMFDATITEINDYPEDANGYYGSGNPNASYYGYTAYIEDSTGLSNGDNLSLSINLGGDEDSSDKIYLDKAYVRKEDGKSYVMKDDGTGHLVKQYVKTGKTIYGYAVEIKSGITMDDYLAFPYGKTAKEGVKTDKGEDSGTAMY